MMKMMVMMKHGSPVSHHPLHDGDPHDHRHYHDHHYDHTDQVGPCIAALLARPIYVFLIIIIVTTIIVIINFVMITIVIINMVLIIVMSSNTDQVGPCIAALLARPIYNRLVGGVVAPVGKDGKEKEE